ncbi:MAG: family 16 glycosylhydrolase [Bacteroidales bacterium]
MKRITLSFFLLLFSIIQVFAQKPVSDPNGSWTLLPDYSDEFNATTGLDLTKWDNNINDWSVWSWEPQNVWLDGTGAMHIKMVNEQHVRGGVTYYFKSGAARQKKTITYGYFEARVKGCQTFPGVCPAFWMYSSQQSLNGVTYNEIDFMEVQQRQFTLKGIDCNTHYALSGSSAWIDTKNYYIAPFAPNDGYHIYGCNVTPTEITFYIDGLQVAKNNNQYFILPMNVILSMGVRPPLMEYGPNGEKLPVVVVNDPDFPTEMLVDYVRVWRNGTTAINEVNETQNILQNYPNPFKDNTELKYNIAKDENVNLSIYDINGRKLKELVNEFKNAGAYTLKINSTVIGGDGVYFCKLETANKVSTIKLIVLK